MALYSHHTGIRLYRPLIQIRLSGEYVQNGNADRQPGQDHLKFDQHNALAEDGVALCHTPLISLYQILSSIRLSMRGKELY